MPLIDIRSYKIPLKWILIIPFILQLLVAMKLVGYLSYRSAKHSLEHLAHHLGDEISGRVSDRLDNYLETHQMLVEHNRIALEAGEINWNDFNALEAHFFREVTQFESITLLSFSNTQGEVIGVGRDHLGTITDPGSLTIWAATGNPPRVGRFYRIDDQGNRAEVIHTTPNFHVTQNEWYQSAISQNQPQWTPIITHVGIPVALISAVRPVYLQGELKGVLHSDILLSDINLFLSSLRIASSGQIFIIEPTGDLVATSTQEKSFINNSEGTSMIRRQAINSQNPLTRAIAQKIQEKWGDFEQIQNTQAMELRIDQASYYINISPYEDGFGLDWFIITAVPTSEFTHQINANVGYALILGGITLASVTGMGMLIAYWIIKPINYLNQANKALVAGTWQNTLSSQTNIAELSDLADAFNQTATQLQKSLRRTETALQASQKKFTTIFSMSPDPIVISHWPELRIIEVNDRFIEFSGYSREELMGYTSLELNLFADVQQERNFEESLKKVGFAYSQEIILQVKSGEHRTILLSAEHHSIEEQEYIIATIRDITEGKQLELALKDSRRKLNEILDNTFASIFSFRVFDDRTWEYNYQSIGSLILWGYTPQELMTDPGLFISRVVPEDRETIFLPLFERFTREDSITVEYRFRHKNGSILWISTTYTSYRDGTLEAWIVTGVSVDISDRKQAELALLDSEERFRSAFNNAGVGMVLVCSKGQFLKVNQAFCQMLGYSEKELLLKNFQEITHPDDLNISFEGFQQLTSGEIKTFQIEKRYISASNSLIWAFLTVSTIRDQDQRPLYFVAQIQDITERHEIDRLKTEFISVVSHELRTPLTSMRGALGLLNAGVLKEEPETTEHMLQIMLRNCDRLIRLVNDILDLERLESGKVPVIKEACEVDDLLTDAVETISGMATEASVTIKLTSISAQVWVCYDAIVQTLTNLLSNAIKFSEEGTTVWLSAQLYNDSNSYILISIKDQGRGIPADKLQTVFGRFQQVDASDARQKDGTGLGLAICKTIIEQHNGRIWVDSILGKGSTFYITLPISMDRF